MNDVLEPPAQPTPGPGDLPSGLKSDVLDVVSDVLQWRLSEARWEQVQQLLNALYEALRAGDPEAVDAATADLELLSPLRMIPIGTQPLEPPVPLRGIVIQIVQDLGEGSGSDDLKDGQDDDTGTGHAAAGR